MTRIRHSVIFKLKHTKGSAEERDFFNAAKRLAGIPGVEKFECLKQVSKKNKFEFGISMEFASQQLYDQYNNHPEHTGFVQQWWMRGVEDFMEIDFEVIR
jgi:heme-degrading monooxygenase HmoA